LLAPKPGGGTGEAAKTRYGREGPDEVEIKIGEPARHDIHPFALLIADIFIINFQHDQIPAKPRRQHGTRLHSRERALAFQQKGT
jgi:hypothetical protein